MIAANELKSGSVFEVHNAPHIVENVVKQTPSARGATTLYKVRARNLLTKSKTDLSCRGDDTFQEPDFQTRSVQYLYQNGGSCVFMDLESYDQYEVPSDTLENELRFMVEDMEDLGAMLLDGRVVGIRLPVTVVLELVECDPAIKGASATARTKPAVTQTGLEIQVPEYMENGEQVKIDTETGRFLSRV
ncbi:MAG: elongation factor P [Lentisphaerae bacterium]|jgi:elongation factor P|nr:elongation factor P [Lentisphaerota bacterium]MBT4817677.1 elongation factor P [Lentisphaerota bacterium]MBT5612048.1 elongation factor P [Lentisphaerota bacterium]MBT7053660.1 elongation factor P [Lentisphaerota bacterium]MBT7842039.1 elongation factor P [Lentisphaerota bacterium]